jgi:hypothetical protein
MAMALGLVDWDGVVDSTWCGGGQWAHLAEGLGSALLLTLIPDKAPG